jgi:uncharacterized damage-inducible protein DinB
MSGYFDDLYDSFSELHADIRKAMEGLPEEALDWIPGEEMNSIATLVVHLAGAEGYWIGVALNEPPARDREAEFHTHGLGTDELGKRLSTADEFTRQSLARFTLDDLAAIRRSPRNGKEFSVGWCLAHALGHSALHLGHIQMTRQLWEQREKA